MNNFFDALLLLEAETSILQRGMQQFMGNSEESFLKYINACIN